MKKRVLFMTLVFSLIIIFLASCGKKEDDYDYKTNYNQHVDNSELYYCEEEDIHYRYYDAMIQTASNKRKMNVPAVYSDEIFFKDSTKFHNFLARQSIGLALASFNIELDYSDEKNIDFIDDDFTNGTLYNYLYSLGFGVIRVDDYFKETSEYTIGTAIAKKKIEKDGEECTLIAVAIRGGNYKNEWQSNLNAGDSIRHEGFDSAATLVTDRVLSYITTLDQLDNYKVWITGFSRAGAIANLVAANLNNSLLFSKEDVYAYTFAAPEPVFDYFDLEKYDNIFNIVNASDFIPQFMPLEWDYRHYGVDYYLPGAEFDSKFDIKYAKMASALKEKNITTNYNTDFNLRMRILYGILLEICPNEYYFTEVLQPVFLYVLANKDLNSMVHLLRKTFINWKENYPDLRENKGKLIDYVLNFLPHLLLKDDFMAGKDNNLTNSVLQVAHEHFPELYYNAIYQLEPNEVFNNNNKFAYIILDKNAKYQIKDQTSNQLLFKIEDGNLERTTYANEQKLNLSMMEIHNQNVLILPYDLNYELEVEALKNRTIDIEIVEYGRAFSSVLKQIQFSKKMDKGSSETLLKINDQEATYNGSISDISAYQFAKDLQIHKGFFNYQFLVLFYPFIISLIFALIGLSIYFIKKKANNEKISWKKFILTSTALIFAIETIVSYFILSDYLYLTIIFEMLAIASVITLGIITYIKEANAKIFKSILPFIIIMAIGSGFLSFSVIATLIFYIIGLAYLIYFYMMKRHLTLNMWIFYIFSLIVMLFIMFIFIREMNFKAILTYIIGALLLLLVFCSSLYEGSKEYITYLIIVSILFMIMYIYRDMHFLYLIFYILIFNMTLVLLALGMKKDAIGLDVAKEQVELCEEKE